MMLIALGLNHHNAPIEILEKTVIPEHRLGSALSALSALPGVEAAAIIATCNRCEIYAELSAPHYQDRLSAWFVSSCSLSADELGRYGFLLTEKEAVLHLMRVAGGVDSMIVGEPQILGQVKTAYQSALHLNATNERLRRLFESALSVAKQVRNETGLGVNPVSFPSLAAGLSKQIFENLAEKQTLMIGTGEMIRLAVERFTKAGVQKMTITGRSQDKARALAVPLQGEVLRFDRIAGQLSRFDIIVSCTSSDTVIVTRRMMEQALKKRKYKPVYMVDLAVPRDFESSITELEDVYIYTLQKLARITDGNLEARRQCAREAEAIIQCKADDYCNWMNSCKSTEMIVRLRDEAQIVRNETLAKARKLLDNGKTPEQALDYLAATLTNKLTHGPTCLLKKAAELNDDEMSEIAKCLLSGNGSGSK